MSDESRLAVAENTVDIMAALMDLYTPEDAKLWMRSAHPMLDGRRAVDMIAQGEGATVLSIIQGMNEGIYI